MERSFAPESKSVTENDIAHDDGVTGLETNKCTAPAADETGAREAENVGDTNSGRDIIVIDARGFFRECLVRTVREYVSNAILSFSNVSDFMASSHHNGVSVIILALRHGLLAGEELSTLRAAIPEAPVIVLSDRNDYADMIEAIAQGAKGYISTKTTFAVAIEAIHLVRSGGTYVPSEGLCLSAHRVASAATHSSSGALTSRELAVIRQLQQGKSNKVIAYDLNMCESTLKVHIRNIMRKMSAQNRTQVVMKSLALL